jgi:hypothetical protein
MIIALDQVPDRAGERQLPMLRDGAVDLVLGLGQFRNGQQPVDDRSHIGGIIAASAIRAGGIV